ncbi:fungal-specific transcription factor domain-containing protein [Aspergillus californicus]
MATSDHGRRYMSKAQRACDACRARKSACRIDVAPPCRLCRAHDQPCEFTPRIRRRRSPLPNYDNTPAQASSISDMVPYPSQSQHVLGEQSNIETPLTALLNQPQPDALFDDLVLSMYDTDQVHVIPQAQGYVSKSLDNLPDLTAELCGLTGDMDPYVLQHYNYDGNSELTFSKLTIRRVQGAEVPVQFLLSKPELSTDSREEAELCPTSDLTDINMIVPPEIGERLITLFFRFIQPQFPIVCQSSPPSPTATPRHLLAAIYCISQPFATFDDHLCIELVYTPPSAKTLLNIAWQSLNRTLSQPTISSVQTALILLLQLPTNPLILDSAHKWTLLGMVVSMGQTLGLHLDPRCWNLPGPEVDLRLRLSWLIYTFDKWFAFSLGRPSHIRKDDWLVTDMVEPGLGSAAEPTSSFVVEFSRLSSILDMTMCSLYSVRSSAILSHDFRLTFETARPLLDALAQWTRQAPDLASQQGLMPLHMAYHAVKILVLRALLRPFNQPNCQIPDAHQAEWEAARTHIRQAARVEINAALHRISSMEAVDYQVFWAPWYKTCFALVTHLIFLLAVSSFKDSQTRHALHMEQDNSDYIELRGLLDHARSVFRLHSKSLDIIKFALLRIDAVFWMGWEKILGFQ